VNTPVLLVEPDFFQKIVQGFRHFVVCRLILADVDMLVRAAFLQNNAVLQECQTSYLVAVKKGKNASFEHVS